MNLTDARREMFLVLQDAWNATAWPVDLYGTAIPVLMYQGRDETTPPNPLLPYSHIYRRSAWGDQAALSDGVTRPFEDMGTLWILNFGLQTSGKGLEMAEFQATIAKKAYSRPNSTSCIWFRNVRAIDVGLHDGLEQINVLVDYEYNETR